VSVRLDARRRPSRLCFSQFATRTVDYTVDLYAAKPDSRPESRFCRAMLCISAAIAVMRCQSVCPSVTFVSCAKTNKDIFEFISPSGSQAILVFPFPIFVPNGMAIFRLEPQPLTGASNAGEV